MRASSVSEILGIVVPRSFGCATLLRGSRWRTLVGIVVLAAAMRCVFSVGVAGAQCIDYGDYLHWMGSVDTPGSAHGVAVSGTHVYVADGSFGLQILPAQCDLASGVEESHRVASTPLLRVYPNPSSGQTFLHFDTRNGGSVQVSVYDVAGRRVRRLFGGLLDSGDHELLWNGCNEDGRAVAAGIYYVWVSAAEGSRTTRFVIVR